jgi:hypothetical protein
MCFFKIPSNLSKPINLLRLPGYFTTVSVVIFYLSPDLGTVFFHSGTCFEMLQYRFFLLCIRFLEKPLRFLKSCFLPKIHLVVYRGKPVVWLVPWDINLIVLFRVYRICALFFYICDIKSAKIPFHYFLSGNHFINPVTSRPV